MAEILGFPARARRARSTTSALAALGLTLLAVAACGPAVEAPDQPVQVNLKVVLDEKTLLAVDSALDRLMANDDSQAAKEGGKVGERADGMLGIVDNAASAEVDAVNARRLAAYTEIAGSSGATLQAVESRAGIKRIAAAAAGSWVLTYSNQWTRKP